MRAEAKLNTYLQLFSNKHEKTNSANKTRSLGSIEIIN